MSNLNEQKKNYTFPSKKSANTKQLRKKTIQITNTEKNGQKKTINLDCEKGRTASKIIPWGSGLVV